MPHLQVSPQTTMAAHKLAYTVLSPLSPLQLSHAAAKARAKEIADREPHLISSFDLGEVVSQIKADQILHGERHEMAEAIALNRVLARLQKLIPIQ